MASSKRGFSAPLALALFSGVLLVAVFGYLSYHGRPLSGPQAVLSVLIENWKKFEKTIPGRPVLGAPAWNYPDEVSFLSGDTLLIRYDDGHILRYSVLSYAGEGKFILLETLPTDKMDAATWAGLEMKYGTGLNFPTTFTYMPVENSSAVSPADWKLTTKSPIAAAPIPQGWLKYEDLSLGLSFYYPLDFTKMNGDSAALLIEDKNGNKIGERSLDLGADSTTTVEAAIINDTVFDASGLHPESFSEYKKVKIGNCEFYEIRTGRFEGQLSYGYYLPLGNKIAVFSFTARGVDWTNPDLDEENNPTHAILRQILTTIQT
ncbi:hypothetical protein KGQ31_00490 [Patescibacteria group bacterium]|nr:hypothetical protein [Patescibacteria group bacterium]